MTPLHVIGGGLAGTEAAWQAAELGIETILYEMRPNRQTPAHRTNRLAELVCSNSLGSVLPDRAPGLLKNELKYLGSLLLRCAEAAAVPAGRALAVDRDGFADAVERAIDQHPRITLIREEVTEISTQPTIVASGPLTSEALAKSIEAIIGNEYLYFYDALSPIVNAESINMDIAFRAGRYENGEEQVGDYINCPMNKAEYERFVAALLDGETIQLREFEQEDPRFFEGCLPIEQIAQRGLESLAFGPMRPVGIQDPRTGRRPHAVVQLRQDNFAGTLYNIVGFQTNLRWGDQKEILRLIPGLEDAEFFRLGQMHRNTFINAPALLDNTMQFRNRDNLWFAGQIVGVEGYVGNIGTGLLAGQNAARKMLGLPQIALPTTTMMGALAEYVAHAEVKHFQPMKANFGILPALTPHVKNKRERAAAYSKRALDDLAAYVAHLEQPKMENSS